MIAVTEAAATTRLESLTGRMRGTAITDTTTETAIFATMTAVAGAITILAAATTASVVHFLLVENFA